jgi:hypothetical protein
MLSEDIGSNYSLRTENTRAVVGALNEIKGKDIISNAVGSPLLFDDTFEVMGEKIKGLTNNFKAKLLNLGVSVNSIDKFEALIGKLDEIDLGADTEELLGPFIESLSGILEDEGVELSGNETLGELIIKVDERFDELHAEINSLETELAGKVTPAGNAVASNVLSGKTFINSTGQTITGTMVNRGGAQTITPGTSNKTLNSGYYSGNITVKGDSNLKAENIVSGKSIFGVSGTAKTYTTADIVKYRLHRITTTKMTGSEYREIFSSDINFGSGVWSAPKDGVYSILIDGESTLHTYNIYSFDGYTKKLLVSDSGSSVDVTLKQNDIVYIDAKRNSGNAGAEDLIIEIKCNVIFAN